MFCWSGTSGVLRLRKKQTLTLEDYSVPNYSVDRGLFKR
jgi:hypothetical protein